MSSDERETPQRETPALEAPGHGHDHDGIAPPTRDHNRLLIAIVIIGVFVVVQFVGALTSGSLALLADTGHMLSDLVALVVALIASIIALRPPTERHTYGFRRFEVFGAAVNGALLLVAGIAIVAGGIGRLLSGEAPEVHSLPMLVVAVVGLGANLAALAVLHGGQAGSMNVRGAYLHVLGDSLGSVLVIVAAVVILATGFTPADAIASLLIAAIIIPRALGLLWQVQRVLSESAPDPEQLRRIREHLLGTEGVLAVHDVHAWQLTPGELVFSAHVAVTDEVFAEGRAGALLQELSGCLHEHFGVAHATFQLEPQEHGATEAHTHA